MLHTETSLLISAPQKITHELYLDYKNWNNLFPLTINGTKLIDRRDTTITVEVDHKTAGNVTNIVTVISDEEIKLVEFKPTYEATFINRFHAFGEETKYTVIANITLRGLYKIVQPFIKGLVKERIRKFVLEPMKEAAERRYKYSEL